MDYNMEIDHKGITLGINKVDIYSYRFTYQFLKMGVTVKDYDLRVDFS